MSDFDRLRRGSYHVDASRRAAQQEASELGRDSYRVDAAAKAAQQEEAERREERAARSSRRRRGAAVRDAGRGGRDMADRSVVRRTAPDPQTPSGGAVVSRRSGVGAAARRWLRGARGTGGASHDESRRRGREPRSWRAGRHPGRRRLNPLAVFLVLLVALYLVVCLPIDRSIAFSSKEREGLSSELSWHVPGMPYYLLVLGSDAREGEEVSRSDTMILVRVDTLGGKLTMLSIPRDTMVEIEGHGTQKINAAYAFGGPAGAVRAVRELTGARISQVAVVRFDGVETLVNYLGGVSVNVPVPVNDPSYTGLVLPAGEQEMDGHTALLFSRVRHGLELGDFQRQKNQRILIEATMRKALSLSPVRMPGLVGAMGGMVGTSMRSYSIFPLMLRLKLGGATVYQAMVPSTTAMVDGVSYVVADEEALARMMDVINAGGDPASLM